MSTEQIECLEPVKGLETKIDYSIGVFPILRLYIEKNSQNDLYNIILELIDIKQKTFFVPIFYKCILLKNLDIISLSDLKNALKAAFQYLKTNKEYYKASNSFPKIIYIIKKILNIKEDEEAYSFLIFIFNDIFYRKIYKYDDKCDMSTALSLLEIVQPLGEINIFVFNMEKLANKFEEFKKLRNERENKRRYIIKIISKELYTGT